MTYKKHIGTGCIYPNIEFSPKASIIQTVIALNIDQST